MKHLYLESYSRRENLKFFGIPDKETNAEDDGEAVDTRAVLIITINIENCTNI